MQTPVGPHGELGGPRGSAALASFRPTARQALAFGLYVGALATLALALIAALAILALPMVDAVAGTALDIDALPAFIWLAVLAPLPLALVASLVAARTLGADCDELGVNGLPLALDGFAPWKLVVNVRAERRRRRTVVAVHLDDGTILRLRAPYNGEILARDPEFEGKLFKIRQLWEVHRDRSLQG
jgi:hypothetical protein